MFIALFRRDTTEPRMGNVNNDDFTDANCQIGTINQNICVRFILLMKMDEIFCSASVDANATGNNF